MSVFFVFVVDGYDDWLYLGELWCGYWLLWWWDGCILECFFWLVYLCGFGMWCCVVYFEWIGDS